MAKLAKSVAAVIEKLSWAGAMLTGLSLLFVVFYILYSVVMRYVFRSPTIGSIELPGFIFLGVVAITLAYVHRIRGHVGVELLAMKLSWRNRRVLDIIGSVSLIIYGAFLAWGSWLKALDHMKSNEHSTALGVPLVYVQMLVVIGMLLLCLQALVEIGKEVAALRAHQE
ncbi:MAG: TRAP transporter small permease [Dehalococcoidales bacterium]|nr:TRAP transporter small permease [Dehalococcoidales bacterium]